MLAALLGPDPIVRLRHIASRMHSSLWITPAIGTVVALVLAAGLIAADHAVEPAWARPLLGAGPEAARELVSTIASSMLTFTAVVFSITIVVLQLASNQFSPRVIRTFLHESSTKVAIGVFIGTFVYAMAVLSQVSTGDPGFVPVLATSFALVMVLASVGVFVHYLHRMAHSVRAITVITKIAAETRGGLDDMFPDPWTDGTPDAAPPRDAADRVIRHAGPPGVVAFVDIAYLFAIACETSSRIEVVPRIGDFVVTGAPLLRVTCEPRHDLRCLGGIVLDIERTPEQDPAFGLRQLVDIGVRALSPGINDPSTAVQAIDHIHDLVRRLTVRALPACTRVDRDGTARLVVPQLSYAEYVELAFDELRLYGATSFQVQRRLRTALVDCLTEAPAPRRAALEEMLGRLAPDQATARA